MALFLWNFLNSKMCQNEASFPDSDHQKLIEVNTEYKLGTFHEKCVATEVDADALSKDWIGVLNHQ